jgi:periodic tryptophan protein 1
VGANPSAREVFASKLAEAGMTLRERESGIGVIGVQSDEEEVDGDDQDD